jgi:hypothetical protein
LGKDRKFRAYTCRICAKKHAWDVVILPEVGRGQCYFCQRVTEDLFETPLIVIEPGVRKKPKGKNVDFL